MSITFFELKLKLIIEFPHSTMSDSPVSTDHCKEFNKYPSRAEYMREQRAAKAISEGRDVGVVGRPQYLDGAEKEKLEKTILNWEDPRTLPTVSEFPQMVFQTSLFSFHIILRNNLYCFPLSVSSRL